MREKMHQTDWFFSSLVKNKGKQVNKGAEADVLIGDPWSCDDCMAE